MAREVDDKSTRKALARIRRAKAFEGLKDLKKALHDYTTVFFAEQQQQVPQSKLSCDEQHMEKLLQDTGKLVAKEIYDEKMKAPKHLPSDTFINSWFLMILHGIHCFRLDFRRTQPYSVVMSTLLQDGIIFAK